MFINLKKESKEEETTKEEESKLKEESNYLNTEIQEQQDQDQNEPFTATINSSTPSSPSSFNPTLTKTTTHHQSNSFHPHLDLSKTNQLREDSDHESFIHHEPESVGVFLQHVGKIPLVSGVVRAYEKGKDTSKMVRYGADLVESSVNSLSDTVVSKVGPERIAQIDRYAGAALDRLGQLSQLQQSSTHQINLGHHRNYHANHHPLDHSNLNQHFSHPSSPLEEPSYDHRQPSNAHTIYHDHTSDNSNYSTLADHFHDHHSYDLDHQFESCDDHMDPKHIHHSSSLRPHFTPRSHTLVQATTTCTTLGNCKNRWQNILVEAGLTAGGIGAAVSEESMKSLQYCLHWLHYATAHLDHQVMALKKITNSLDEEEAKEQESLTHGRKTEAMTRLATIKKEVVETIRKVVDVVSKYARVGLPEPAKEFVRKSILGLPLRWASAIRVNPFINYSSDFDFGDNNLSPIDQRQSLLSPTNNSHTSTQIAAHRVLTFAIESLNMLKSITGTISESVERAEAWVGRLRLIGFQNKNNPDPAPRRQQQRQRKWENDWRDNQEEEEERSCRMRYKNGDRLNLMRRRISESRSRSLGRYQRVRRARSRSSSRSSGTTFDEDNMSLISEKSIMSSYGCDLSTIESVSLISSNNTTTLTSCTSNDNQLVHQDYFGPASVDRSTAKRRKTNDNLINRLHPLISDNNHLLLPPSNQIDSMKTCSSCDDDETRQCGDVETSNNRKDLKHEHLTGSRDIQVSQPGLVDLFEDCNSSLKTAEHRKNLDHNDSLSSPTSTLSSSKLIHSNSLKKILLDPDQVHHLNLQLPQAYSSAHNAPHHAHQIS